MSFFEDDDWFRKLLQDQDILEQLGLPTDLSEEEIDELVEQMENNPALLEAIEMLENEIQNPDAYIHNEIPYDFDKTPAKNFIEEACLDLGLKINTDQDLDKMKVGSTYMIIFPNKKIVTAQLENVVEQGHILDYIFYNIDGAEDLLKVIEYTGEYAEGVFPIPQTFLYSTIIREVRD